MQLNETPIRLAAQAVEWVFVFHHLLRSGVVRAGSRGLVFGVGSERLPAVFASMGCKVTATDAPLDIGVDRGWQKTGEHISSIEQIRYTDIADRSMFDQNVEYQTCDMNEINPDLNGYDFNWSSCCFEHLGSLEAGMEFIINAVERTLRPGGVAVHTTEFNLSSDIDTIESGPTVIYRNKDLIELSRRLQERGHIVKSLTVAPGAHYWDSYVDLPPYMPNRPHLKLMLGSYVATSVGVVIQRGK